MMVSKFGISFSRDFFAVSMLNFRGVFLECKNFHWKTLKKGFPPQKDESMVDLPMKSTPQNQKMARIELPRWVSLEWLVLPAADSWHKIWTWKLPMANNGQFFHNLPMLQITHLQGAFKKKQYITTKNAMKKHSSSGIPGSPVKNGSPFNDDNPPETRGHHNRRSAVTSSSTFSKAW